MQAAINAAESSISTDNTTGENMLQVLKKQPDSVIAGHYDHIGAIIFTILERKAKTFKPELNQNDRTFRGVKFVISEYDLLLKEAEAKVKCAQLERDQGLTLGHMEERDIALMLKLNGVQYDTHYGRHIIKCSACFRCKEGSMVAWAGTHGDFSITALHVLPDYRKLGLGRLVLWYVTREHMHLARKAIKIRGTASEIIPTTALYAHADSLEYNLPTMIFTERCGWRRIGIYNWVGLHVNPKA
ncbi:hypothetical protein BG003_009450 [Podila horticola]|nr:hypothetical protein BG003_009450 [Podila horticola]